VFCFIPATSIVTGDPAAVFDCFEVASPYVKSGPNWTVTVAGAGGEIVY
jgi:hypothetical protein